ncbi:sigma-54-dependent transcriptional regulator [Candidatus Latescibacterota bacterium]
MAQKILVVDDEKKIRIILEQILSDEGFKVKTAESGEEALDALNVFGPDLILMDQNMPGMDGIEAMSKILEKQPELTIIIITAYGSIKLAVEAMKKGAYDFISKPFDNDELIIVINRALERNRLTEEILNLKGQLKKQYSFENIIGVSPVIQRMFEQMRRVCETNASVLIQGESGTGKELVAKAIHYHSKRKDKPMVSVNCGAIPENLIESEFFGYEKGAFTDAKERTIGKFEQADGGTLFLDEIGELTPDAQVKLLRVFEEKAIVRIGGKETIPIDVRILAATNKNLKEEVDRENFRLDLFYRLDIFTITVPPLSARNEDIPLLVEYFIQKHNKQLGLEVKSISQSAIKLLSEYDWPGNVRNLENAIQSAMILAQKDMILAENLPLRMRGYPEVSNETCMEDIGMENYIKQFISKFEKECIVSMMRKYNNNRTLTAEALKISRKTLFNKIREYEIE